MKENPISECPQCHDSSFQRGPGGGLGLHFKGSGFYITDYDSNIKPEYTKESGSSDCCPCGKNSCSTA